MPIRLTTTAALITLAVGAPAASASVGAGHAGTRDFATAAPRAAALCTRAQNGALPARLSADAPAILTACTTFQTAYGDAAQTYATALAPIRTQAQQARATFRTARAGDRRSGNRSAVPAARAQERATLRTLRGEARTDRHTFHVSFHTARAAFRSTIRGLRHPGASTTAGSGSGATAQ